MKFPAFFITALLSLYLPLSLAAPVANPAAPCVVKSVNGQTTPTGDCGGNQQALVSSSGGGDPATVPDTSHFGASAQPAVTMIQLLL